MKREQLVYILYRIVGCIELKNKLMLAYHQVFNYTFNDLIKSTFQTSPISYSFYLFLKIEKRRVRRRQRLDDEALNKLSLKINTPNEVTFNLINMKYLAWCCWQRAYCSVESFCFIVAMHLKYRLKNGMKEIRSKVKRVWQHSTSGSSWCWRSWFWSNCNFCNVKIVPFFTMVSNFRQYSKCARASTPAYLQASLQKQALISAVSMRERFEYGRSTQ